MKILIVDNNVDRHSWGAENLVRFARKVPGATIHVRRGPSDDLPPLERAVQNYDRLVMSGSRTSCLDHFPWVEKLENLARAFVQADKPVLGVCYGHQVLARAFGGRDIVRKGQKPEFGWTRIETTTQSPLFSGLPKVFYSYSSHFEEVARLAPGFVHLARSQDCGIQAVQLEGKRVFGIQFHPEKNIAEAEEIFKERRTKGAAAELLGDGKSEVLFDPKVGEMIFSNFYGC
jgi:GMP synthase-like glutamine amidotransferase